MKELHFVVVNFMPMQRKRLKIDSAYFAVLHIGLVKELQRGVFFFSVATKKRNRTVESTGFFKFAAN